MSVVAGFVEPGESAEMPWRAKATRRPAIVVGQVRYLGSQPWPIPRSLMLGFQATAKGGQRIEVGRRGDRRGALVQPRKS